MNLIFKKDDNADISVLLKVDGQEQEFSYIEMIRELIKAKKMDDPEISGAFSEAETNSINSMVSFINKEMPQMDAT